MHRAKHRAGGRDSADVLATTLIERYAGPRSAPICHTAALALAERPDGPVELPGGESDGDLGEARLFGAGLFGASTPTGPLLAVDAAAPAVDRAAAPLFRDDAEEPRSPFGASRHAAHPVRRPRPEVKLRPQPVGAALTVTVLGAAAAVTAVVAPPVAGRVDQRAAARPEGCSRPRPGHPDRPRPGRRARAGAADGAGLGAGQRRHGGDGEDHPRRRDAVHDHRK